MAFASLPGATLKFLLVLGVMPRFLLVPGATLKFALLSRVTRFLPSLPWAMPRFLLVPGVTLKFDLLSGATATLATIPGAMLPGVTLKFLNRVFPPAANVFPVLLPDAMLFLPPSFSSSLSTKLFPVWSRRRRDVTPTVESPEFLVTTLPSLMMKLCFFS